MDIGNGFLVPPATLVQGIRRAIVQCGRRQCSVLIDRQGEVSVCAGPDADITATPTTGPAIIARAVVARLLELIPESTR